MFSPETRPSELSERMQSLFSVSRLSGPFPPSYPQECVVFWGESSATGGWGSLSLNSDVLQNQGTCIHPFPQLSESFCFQSILHFRIRASQLTHMFPSPNVSTSETLPVPPFQILRNSNSQFVFGTKLQHLSSPPPKKKSKHGLWRSSL